ncbi:acetyl-CoA carboxylase biotin carboxylase subunit [Candidatus Parcubacteria bacterium]|nr:acetyl-CoA carboxylase biotin carboxylase subunit [Candidatus Parcubacteria bacterium]
MFSQRFKKLAKKLKIPTLQFSEESICSLKDLKKWLSKISPPIVLKARRGGGGIGIRAINGEISIGEIFTLALGVKRQVSSAFLDVDFFLEKYLPQARHIEIQILGDGKNFLHLGERECSIQRRFQKIIEEAPSPFVDALLREKLTNCALKFAKETKYQSVGTVEFLVDQNKNFYFMEINPRIQVEHPVTEAICGIDLVEQQIRVAQGENLKISQKDISFQGWAIEVRVNAEDPFYNFKPSPGKITRYLPPGGHGIFVHTFLHEGQEIFPYFDPLLAKIIGFGKNRQEAISKLKRALSEIVIEGVKTNIPFLKAIFEEENFLQGNLSTDFIEREKILEKMKIPEICKVLPRPKELSEEKIAEIVYQVYKALKEKEEKKEEKISKWQLFQRLSFFEE